MKQEQCIKVTNLKTDKKYQSFISKENKGIKITPALYSRSYLEREINFLDQDLIEIKTRSQADSSFMINDSEDDYKYSSSCVNNKIVLVPKKNFIVKSFKAIGSIFKTDKGEPKKGLRLEKSELLKIQEKLPYLREELIELGYKQAHKLDETAISCWIVSIQTMKKLSFSTYVIDIEEELIRDLKPVIKSQEKECEKLFEKYELLDLLNSLNLPDLREYPDFIFHIISLYKKQETIQQISASQRNEKIKENVNQVEDQNESYETSSYDSNTKEEKLFEGFVVLPNFKSSKNTDLDKTNKSSSTIDTYKSFTDNQDANKLNFSKNKTPVIDDKTNKSSSTIDTYKSFTDNQDANRLNFSKNKTPAIDDSNASISILNKNLLKLDSLSSVEVIDKFSSKLDNDIEVGIDDNLLTGVNNDVQQDIQ